jgi:type I restriction enzyme S subunit
MVMVKSGYKQTEIGVIPEDWELMKIDDIAEVDCENLSSITNPNLEINYISLECINEGTLVKYDEVKFQNAPSRARRVLRKGDILVSTVRPNLRSHYFFNLNEVNFIGSTGFSVIRTNESSNYIYHHFFAEIVNKQIENLIVGSNYPAINNKDVKNIQIPLPPLPEQQAIAAALSDADAWIKSLEQLIAKKRLLKQGAIQELLTPKEDWEVRKLGEVCEFKNGAAHENAVDENGKFIIVNSKFISQEGRVRKCSNAFLCPLYEGEIVMVMSDIPNGKALAKCYIIDSNNTYSLNQRICAFKAHDDFDTTFLYYKINRNGYFLGFDSGTGQTNLRRDEVLNCPIFFPKLNEQTRIATILSDMNLELEALVQQLEKARQIKQGMMQELLTGRIRLI